MSDQQQPQLTPHDAAMLAKMEASTASSQALVDRFRGVAPAPAPVAAPVAAPAPAAAAPAQAPAAAPAAAPQRPANVPEKFWDAKTGTVNTEALLKSYTELEAARSQVAKPGEQPPANTGEPPAPGEGQPDPAAAAVQAAGLDMAALDQEFAQSGALSDASYAALEKAGIPKATVDSYIEGQVALANARNAEGFALVGGQEQYAAMVQWAQGRLSAADLEAFDASVTGSSAQMKQAILAMKAQYEAATGTDPTLLGGNPAQASAGLQPFASRAEVTEAMRDPRYRKDSAYRAMVEQRVGLMDNF